jgi:hypothetical protein
MPPYEPYRACTGAVHHIDPNCPVGRQIPSELMVEDDGGLPLCPTCRIRSEARPPSGPFVQAEWLTHVIPVTSRLLPSSSAKPTDRTADRPRDV